MLESFGWDARKSDVEILSLQFFVNRFSNRFKKKFTIYREKAIRLKIFKVIKSDVALKFYGVILSLFPVS